MSYEDCGICGHFKFTDKHCANCGAYHVRVNGASVNLNHCGTVMVRAKGIKSLLGAQGLRTFVPKNVIEKLSARLAGHVFTAQ